MITGVRGRLITATFAEAVLPTLPGAGPPSGASLRAVDLWSDAREVSVGPASSIRAISDVVVAPLLKILGFEIGRRDDQQARSVIHAALPSRTSIPVIVVSWGEPLDRAWRAAVVDGIRADARWCFCCNGIALRIIDAQHTWTRRYLEFDLSLLSREREALTILWTVARAEAFTSQPPVLERAVELSARHGITVCKALGSGVLDALGLLFAALSRQSGDRRPHLVFQDSLTVLYRMLFLLFAEARGLLPIWHPVYRDRYSLEIIVSTLLAGRRYRGVWAAIRAISRLVAIGCSAGELKVNAFNGRLFSADSGAAFDRAAIDEGVMGRAVMAMTTTTAGRRAEPVRIAYRDLDVEQLGAVYERVLEYEPSRENSRRVRSAEPALLRPTELALRRTRDTRKSTGTFYTPRGVTAYLVQQALEPLVRNRDSEAILRLRVLDPAMGSGAFLVGACRYLAGAAEDALVREGRWHHADITAADRAALKREIAQRCLFGVDANPMAVQLARLSLWLATLASEKPLSFLDHRLVAGDSLIGASPDDVRRQPSRGQRATRRQEPLPLFDGDELTAVLERAVRVRTALAAEADDSAAAVKDKERRLAALQAPQSPLGRWWRVLDLWCAGWFWEHGPPPGPGAFAELCDRLLHGRSSLPERTAADLLARAEELAARYRFLHWPLAFPEVFCTEEGARDPRGGFDAVIGNPPWDMVRGDSGDEGVRAGRKAHAHQLTDFVREAGIYRVESQSHVNRYQLFVERSLQLVRDGGRVGLVLPSGVITDAGAAPLRRHLFDRADVDSITGLDNRGAVFPIHRSVRFVLMTATAGSPTNAIACRLGISRLEELGERDGHAPLMLTRRFLARFSGADDLAVPEIAGETDLRIVEKISGRFPPLGAADGWNVHFGRELNASDDRGAFEPFDVTKPARPVLEGKHIQPFRVSLDRCRYQLRAADVSKRVPRRARLAYRDVASATNRLTLIAAIVPARAVTIHTLFCLKTPLAADAQHVLCALLNSSVANYLIRLRVNTHVTASLISRLRVPLVAATDPSFTPLASLSRTLTQGAEPVEHMSAYVELQARVAQLYSLTADDFTHILSTFPLIPEESRSRTLAAFNGLH